ncbi:unnamed protein product [marine sediment metagenome]|uniref:Uncharacterized protein n=1 Tax=marine sediment metagenome TaxID=412755 RepID=X0ZAM4_9ZZZZ
MILKVWDNGGKSFDRYTVRVRNDYFGMSKNPSSPQGFNQYAGSYPEIDESSLGKKIKCLNYRQLPYEIRGAITIRT